MELSGGPRLSRAERHTCHGPRTAQPGAPNTSTVISAAHMSVQHACEAHSCGAEGHLLARDSHSQTRAATTLRGEDRSEHPPPGATHELLPAAAARPSLLALEPAILMKHAEGQQLERQHQHPAAPPQLHVHSGTTSQAARIAAAVLPVTHAPAEPALPLAKFPTGVSYMASTEDSISYMLGLASTDGPNDGQARRTSYFRIWCTRGLSMRCFHLAWLGFFWATFSTFAPAALLPAIKADLGLSKGVIGGAGMAALAVSIVLRIVMVYLVRMYGPRYCQVFLLLLTAPALACMGAVVDGPWFVLVRLAVGSSLGLFVVAQFWVVAHFSSEACGPAAGACAALGNSGAGAAMVIMPLLYVALKHHVYGGNSLAAWQSAFYLPAAAHILVAVLTLAWGQDTPDGDLLDPKRDWYPYFEAKRKSAAARRGRSSKSAGSSSHVKGTSKRQGGQDGGSSSVKYKERDSWGALPTPDGARPSPRAPAPLLGPPPRGAPTLSPPPPLPPAPLPPPPPPPPPPLQLPWSAPANWSAGAVAAAANDTELPPALPQREAARLLSDTRQQQQHDLAVLAASPSTVGRDSHHTLPYTPAQAWGLEDRAQPPGEEGSNRARWGAAQGQGHRQSSRSQGEVAAGASPQLALHGSMVAGGVRACEQEVPAAVDQGCGLVRHHQQQQQQQQQQQHLTHVQDQHQHHQCALQQQERQQQQLHDQAFGQGQDLSGHNQQQLYSTHTTARMDSGARIGAGVGVGIGHGDIKQQQDWGQGQPRRRQHSLPHLFIARRSRSSEQCGWSGGGAGGSRTSTQTGYGVRRAAAIDTCRTTAVHDERRRYCDRSSRSRGGYRCYTGPDEGVYVSDGSEGEAESGQQQHHHQQGSHSLRDVASLYLNAACNPRTLLLALNYGYSFGAQLCIFNELPLYLARSFGLSTVAAGCLASIFGLLSLVARPAGAALAQHASRTWGGGMRARLWLLFATQLLGGCCCAVMGGAAAGSPGGTAACIVLFAVCSQMACGALFSIAPFVTFRSYPCAMSVISAGGQLGAVLMQGVFFTREGLSYSEGFQWMGVTIAAMASTLLLLRFPMWGSMLRGPTPQGRQGGEEAYYLQEWSEWELAHGVADAALQFAEGAKAERGSRWGGAGGGNRAKTNSNNNNNGSRSSRSMDVYHNPVAAT